MVVHVLVMIAAHGRDIGRRRRLRKTIGAAADFLQAVNDLLELGHLDDGVGVQDNAAVPAAGGAAQVQPAGRHGDDVILTATTTAVVFIVLHFDSSQGQLHAAAAADSSHRWSNHIDWVIELFTKFLALLVWFWRVIGRPSSSHAVTKKKRDKLDSCHDYIQDPDD